MGIYENQPVQVIKVFSEGRDTNECLADLSYENFVRYLFESGSSDTEYEEYLRQRNMVDVTDYNCDSTIDQIELVLEQRYRGRVLKFKCIYDSELDGDFDKDKYFKVDVVNKNFRSQEGSERNRLAELIRVALRCKFSNQPPPIKLMTEIQGLLSWKVDTRMGLQNEEPNVQECDATNPQ